MGSGRNPVVLGARELPLAGDEGPEKLLDSGLRAKNGVRAVSCLKAHADRVPRKLVDHGGHRENREVGVAAAAEVAVSTLSIQRTAKRNDQWLTETTCSEGHLDYYHEPRPKVKEIDSPSVADRLSASQLIVAAAYSCPVAAELNRDAADSDVTIAVEVRGLAPFAVPQACDGPREEVPVRWSAAVEARSSRRVGKLIATDTQEEAVAGHAVTG
jgi:hypothetical protein